MPKQHTHDKDSQVPDNQEKSVEDTTKAQAETKASPETASSGKPEPAGKSEASQPGAAESGGPQKSGASAEKALEAKVVALEAELSTLKDQYLRKAADFENYRKRSIKEKQEAIDFANQSILMDLVTVMDDFERAIKSAETAKDYDTFHDGIVMIEKRLSSQLESKWGLSRFESAGKPFDPNRHEAIMMDKSADVKEPTVAEDFQRGYLLKERVVRSAKVKVVMPDEDVSAAASGDSAPDVTTKA